MLKNAGEFQLSGSMGSGFELQSAVAVTDNFGLMMNYYSVKRRPDGDGDEVRHKLFEGGIGYFTNKGPTFFELYAGFGRGKGTSTEDLSFFGGPSYATGRYSKIFFQPAVGFNKRAVHVSFVSRFSIIDFVDFDDGTSRIEIDGKSQGFFEPAVVGRWNFASNQIFLQWQMGASIPLMKEPYFDYNSGVASIGLGFRIGGSKPDSEKKIRE